LNEADIKRIEKKVDLLFKLCFKNEMNYTYGSFSWEEIKESISLFNISAKKVDIKDFPTREERDKYINKIDSLRVKLKKDLDDYWRKQDEEIHEINENIPFPREEIEVLKNCKWDKKDEYDKKSEELLDLSNAIETLTYGWFSTTWGSSNLKENIEKNYRAQFVNDMLKKLGIKRREDDCAEYIGEVIKANKQLKEIFKKIDNSI